MIPYSDLTKERFETWKDAGYSVAGRSVKVDPFWGSGVWWNDEFGVCSPIVASLGGPLGHQEK